MIELDDLFKGADKGLLDAVKKADISSVYSFAAKTNERSERRDLAQTLNYPKYTLYYYAKLANLLLCPEISLDQAKFLVETGVRCLDDIFYLNTEKYFAYLSEFGYSVEKASIDEAKVSQWIAYAREFKKADNYQFECEETDPQNRSYAYFETQTPVKKTSTSMGVDLRDIISELGAGLADAQKALDLNSIAVQKQILADPELRNYGLNATWYTIPETTFSLKMTYHFDQGSSATIEGKGDEADLNASPRGLRMRIIPSNATFNNTYKTSGEQESTLTLRFVPVPPPEGTTDRIQMPNLIGNSVDEAITTLQELGLEYELVRVKGEPKNGLHTEVMRQSLSTGATITDLSLLDIEPNTYLMARTRITLSYRDDESGADPTESTLRAVLSEVNEAAAKARESASAAESSAQKAESSASAAKNSAAGAKSSAASAEKAAKDTETNSSAAKKSASSAEKAAKEADSSAAAAKKSAKEAQTNSSGLEQAVKDAKSSATEAKQSASNAKSSASEAKQSATNAKKTASDLDQALQEVQSRSTDAVQAADDARQAADELRQAADDAKQAAADAANAADKAEAISELVEAAVVFSPDKRYRIRVQSFTNKVETIKVLRELLGIDLKKAKEILDAAPAELPKELEQADALEWRKRLNESGAIAVLVEV